MDKATLNGKISSGRAITGKFKRAFKMLYIISTSSFILYSCSSAERKEDNVSAPLLQKSIDNAVGGAEEQSATSVSMEKAKGEVTTQNPLTSSAARITKADSTHTFIRTSDIKFRVKDVTAATYKIEDIVAEHDGFVSYTNLASNMLYTNRTKFSEDSILETSHYRVDNSLTIRVPNTQLDAVLRQMAPLMEFLDHRNIKADNIGFTLLSNKMTESRLKKHNDRLTKAIDERGKKLNETNYAEENLLSKEQLSDESKLRSMELMEQVEYSTVTIYIYQPETIAYTVLPSEKTPPAYEPSFGSRLLSAAKTGWFVLKEVIIFLVQIWGILLFAFLLYIGVKRTLEYFSRPEIKKA